MRGDGPRGTASRRTQIQRRAIGLVVVVLEHVLEVHGLKAVCPTGGVDSKDLRIRGFQSTEMLMLGVGDLGPKC